MGEFVPRPLSIILEDFGGVMDTTYGVIKTLYSYMGYQDLVNATQISQRWRHVAKTFLKIRRKLRYVTAHPDNLYDTQLQVLNNMPSQMKVLENLIEKMNEYPLELIPFHCIAFAAGGWLSKNDIVTKFSPNGSTLSKILTSSLYGNSELVLVEASGIVGSVEMSEDDPIGEDMHAAENRCDMWYIHNSLNRVSYSIEVEDSIPRIHENGHNIEGMEALSVVLIPKQFGVRVKIFQLCEAEFYKTYRANLSTKEKRIEVTPDEFNSICDLKPDEDLKCLLLFTNNLKGLTRSFLHVAQKRQNNRVAIGGGLVDWLQQHGNPFKGTIGIAISGSNVLTASIVIPSSVRDADAFRNEIEKLKMKALPEGHSMAFMFACCGRGSSWYRRAYMTYEEEYMNVESRVFRTFFPNTPLFGFFGDGEIGNNFYSSEEGSCSKRRRKGNELVHQFSTVLVLLSFV